MKKNIWKKLGTVTPVLVAGTLVATSLPNIPTFADPAGETQDPASTQTIVTTRAAEGRLSRDTIRNIVLETVKGGEIKELELDDRKHYEVEVMADGIEYEMKIDAFTGEIVKLETDRKKTKPSVERKESTRAERTETAGRKRITADEARTIALKKVGGGIISGFDQDDGEFDIEIRHNGKEYDLEINAYSGKVTEFEVENVKKSVEKVTKPSTRPSTKGASEKATKAPVKKSRLSEDEVRKIALDKVGGGKVVDFDYDDGEYEIEIRHNGNEYDLEINAYSGKVTEFEVDDVKKAAEKSTKPSTEPSSKKSRISEDEARKIALDKVGGGKVVDFDYDDGEYEIEIRHNGKEYDLEINAYSGKVTEFEVDDVKKAAEKTTKPSTEPSSKKSRISEDEARKIALDKVGGGKVVDFDYDDGEYEIEIRHNENEYEIDINAYTGKITDFDADEDNDNKMSTRKTRISSERARKIALDRVGGGKVVDFDYDDGEYEIEIRYNGKEYEIEMNAYTGKITDFDIDD